MEALRQILVVCALNFRGLHHRIWSSLVIVGGVACVVAVLVSILSLTAGIARSYAAGTGSERAIVLAAGAMWDDASSLTHEEVNFARDVPGVKRAGDGSPLADAQVVISLPVSKKSGALEATVMLRGLSAAGFRMHPNLRIVAGRMLRPGAGEVIVGVGAERQFTGLALGSTIALQHGRWPIVGMFRSDGDLLEGEILADADTLMPAIGHKDYNSVILDLAGPAALASLQRDVARSPQFKVRVERQSDYYARTTRRFSGFFTAIAFGLGGLMAIGAVFGTVNTLYSAVSTRSREIATLRALGFGALAVAASVILEALLLSLIGAVLGAATAWVFFNGDQKVLGTDVFNLSVTPALVGIGVLWAVGIALIGAALPSVRAARAEIVVALRAV
jgi:putative ABC transport system permease protein